MSILILHAQIPTKAKHNFSRESFSQSRRFFIRIYLDEMNLIYSGVITGNLLVEKASHNWQWLRRTLMPVVEWGRTEGRRDRTTAGGGGEERFDWRECCIAKLYEENPSKSFVKLERLLFVKSNRVYFHIEDEIHCKCSELLKCY